MSIHFDPSPPFAPRRAAPVLLAALLSAVAPISPSRAAAPTDWEGTYPILPPSTRTAASVARTTRATPSGVTEAPGSAGVWELVAPPSGTPFFDPSMVYDSTREQLIAFGGEDSVARNQTWVFTIATGQWGPLVTSGTPPPARRLHGAVYDPVGDRVVIFGGWADGLLDDVWQLSLQGTPTWTELHPADSPGGRAGFATVYDAVHDRMLIFGGYDGSSPFLGRTNDVWGLALDGPPTWTRLEVSGTPPSPRIGASAGYDPSTRAMYVFGGSDSTYSSQLWKLALDSEPTWSEVVPFGGAAPSARTEQSGAFDPVSHRLVVFGGYGSGALFSDLWVIDPSSSVPQWQDVTPDPTIRARFGAGSAITPSGSFYVAGGVNASGRLEADVWRIQVANPVEWEPVSDLFPYRLQEVMVMDPSRHRFVAFGGSDGAYRNDTYVHALDTGRGWQRLVTSGTPPPPRRLHTGIYDPNGDRLVVFGGFDDHLLGDLWQLTFSGVPTWSPLAAQGAAPSPRGGHVSVYDPVGQRMIVACGYDGATLPAYRTGSTYALSLTGTPTWTRLPDGPPRSSATAVYDAARGSMVVFGGTDPDFLGDTWQLSLGSSPTWSQLDTGAGPAPREEQSAVYDAHRDRMVIFGGYDTPTPYSHNYDDLWSLGLSSAPAWVRLDPEGGGPTPRWGMKALADSELDGMWLYGGWDGSYSQQLFFLQWSDPESPATIATEVAQAAADHVALEWRLPARPKTTVTVQRTSDGVHWRTVSDLLVSGTRVSFIDRDVTAGARYAWRSVVSAGIPQMISTATWLDVTGAGAVPNANPTFGLRLARALGASSVSVWCTLATKGAARVDLLDVTGRLRDTRDLSSLGPGEHRVELGRDLEAGVFFVRLVSGDRRASLKGAVLN